jgi:predicted DCC family thiol-disulfide oxidoreductase YuxK
VKFVADRDSTDHMRFTPLQTEFAEDLCERDEKVRALTAVSAVLIDEEGYHVESDAILRISRYLDFPFNVGGLAGLRLPRIVRNPAYRTFAKNRGTVSKGIKRVIRRGEDTYMEEYRDRILGLEEPLEPSWGFKQRSN